MGCPIPSTQVVRIMRDDPKIEFAISYDPPIAGRNDDLDRLIAYPQKTLAPYFIINIRVSMDANGIVGFDQAQTIEEFNEAPKETVK
jgi:hypothetical protein